MADLREARRAPTIQESKIFIRKGIRQAILRMVDDPLDNTGRFRGSADIIGVVAHVLPKGTIELKDGFRTLVEALTDEGEKDPLSSPLRTFTALMLADVLTYQTSLPLEKRKKTKLRYLSGTTADMDAVAALAFRPPHRQDEETLGEHETVVQRISEIQERIDRALDHSPIDTEEMERQLRLVDATAQLELRNSIPHAIFADLGSPAVTRWIKKVREKSIDLSDESLATDLLLQGKIENIHLWLRFIIWGSPITDKLLLGETDRDEPRYKALAEYFFGHPELQETFWKTFSLGHPIQLPKRASDLLGIKQILSEHPIVEWFFMQDSEMVADFLATRAIPRLTSQQNESLMRRLTGVNLIFRRHLPDNPNGEVITRILGIISLGMDEEFAIIHDEKPGIIYLDRNNEARPRVPKSGQTKEGFLAQERKRDAEIVYISNVPWPEHPVVQEPSRPISVAEPAKRLGEPALTIIPASVEFLEHWAGVGVVETQDIARVIEFLDKNVGVTEDEAFNMLDEYANRKKGSIAHVILPGIFSDNELIKRLANVGVLAVSRDGNKVNFIIDPQATKIDVDGNVGLISLKGALNQQNELIFEDEFIDTSTTSLHLLMNAAAVLAGARIIVEPRKGKPLYSDQELRGVGKKIDEWNARARAQNLPLLHYGERQRSDGPRVLLPIDKTFAFPTLATK